MEARGVCELGEDDRCEIEAAEALAGLAQSSAARGGDCRNSAPSEDQAIGNTSGMAPCAFVTEETIRNEPSLLCGAIKSTGKVTEAEKEARRFHRVLANRESARQTIRRRQVMRLELMRKVAYLSEENKNLKKEKELAVKDYECLKVKNEFLKLQMEQTKNMEPKSSGTVLTSSATKRTPILLYNQPSLVPLFWPSVVPYSNVFQLQLCPDVSGSSQFPVQHLDLPPSHQGQESSRPGDALLVLPVPWLLPILGQSNALNSHSDTNRGSKETLSAHQCSAYSPLDVIFVKDNHQSSSNPSTRIEASNSSRTITAVGPHVAECTCPEDSGDHSARCHLKHNLVTETSRRLRSIACSRSTRHARAVDINDSKNVSAPEHISRSVLKKNQESLICWQKKSENNSAAVKARRRRKELMRMKNTDYHHFRMQSMGN